MLDVLKLDVQRQYGVTFYLDSSKRWVSQPNNFVTLKAQPRKGDLVITVYGKPEDFRELESNIRAKLERSAYSRFNISDQDQLTDTLRIIRRAFELKQARGRPS